MAVSNPHFPDDALLCQTRTSLRAHYEGRLDTYTKDEAIALALKLIEDLISARKVAKLHIAQIREIRRESGMTQTQTQEQVIDIPSGSEVKVTLLPDGSVQTQTSTQTQTQTQTIKTSIDKKDEEDEYGQSGRQDEEVRGH